MSTDFNNSLDTSLQSESKLTQNSGKVARFAYTQQAFDTDTVAGTESYNYNQEQNIPLADSEILQISDTILSKGLRSQASSFTRMGVNHFFGRCSYNINKLASHLKTLFETLISFMREGDNAWSPTAIYKEGDVVYFMSTQNSKPCKRTFVCKLDCPSANLPPVYTDGSLINTTYWDEISGRMASLEVGTSGSSGTTVATINGDIDINGDIYQNGTPYETHAEQLYTKKDTIIMREDAVAALPAGTYSGLKVLKYDGTNNCALAVDNTGTARVGDYNPDNNVDDTQPLLTRCETNDASLANGVPLIWDATNKRAVGGSFASSPIISANSTTFTGIALNAGFIIKVQFTADISGADGSTPLAFTYNNSVSPIPVKVAKDGALVDVYAKEVQTNIFKYLQAYTTLELLYDGTNFVILGNPVVFSSADYVIYADGYYKYKKFTDKELWTGKFWIDGKPIYSKVVHPNTVSIGTTWTTLMSATGWSVENIINMGVVGQYLNSAYGGYFVRWQLDSNNIRVESAAAWSISSAYFVAIEYTKSTDTAGTVPLFVAP